jgi:hypothetical protein
MKSLPSVCALGIVIVTKRHEVSTKANDKRFRASVQCTAYLTVKSIRYDRLIIRGMCM